MKKLAVACAVLLAMTVVVPTAEAQSRPDGLGVGVGQGTGVSGISGKVHQGDTALQGVIGSWRGRSGGLGFSGDYLFNMDLLADEGALQIAWNLGLGGAVGISAPRYSNALEAHAQFVAGLEFIIPEIPLEVVLEARPSVRLLPTNRVFVLDRWDVPWAGGHIRVYLD